MNVTGLCRGLVEEDGILWEANLGSLVGTLLVIAVIVLKKYLKTRGEKNK